MVAVVDQHIERRLAAILAADVAGYSRLTGAEEEGTLGRLRAMRKDVVDPTISTHHGHIVKTRGDGMLVEFASVVDAVRCAVELQLRAGPTLDGVGKFPTEIVTILHGRRLIETKEHPVCDVELDAGLRYYSDPGGMKTRAEKVSDGYRITGSKMWISNARWRRPDAAPSTKGWAKGTMSRNPRNRLTPVRRATRA